MRSGTPVRLVCFGSGPKFKGGLSDFNSSLARALDGVDGVEVHLISWSVQYPAIIPRSFVDRSSKTEWLQGSDIPIRYMTDFNKPWTWRQTADYILSLDPHAVIWQWSIAAQGLPMGRMMRYIRKRRPDIRLILDVHFVRQREQSALDRRLMNFTLRQVDAFITHSASTTAELRETYPEDRFIIVQDAENKYPEGSRPVLELFHPIYDLFEPQREFDIQKFKNELGLREHVFLFFGFIRRYKGLHNLLRAFKILEQHREDVSLLVVGESFWDTMPEQSWRTRTKKAAFKTVKRLLTGSGSGEEDYRPLRLIDELGIEQVCLVNEYVPNEEVHRYFQVSDATVLYYEYATPSGIESISYNFKKPILATSVGHFAGAIQPGLQGYLAEPGDVQDMARILEYFIEHPIDAEQLSQSIRHMTWEHYAESIVSWVRAGINT